MLDFRNSSAELCRSSAVPAENKSALPIPDVFHGNIPNQQGDIFRPVMLLMGHFPCLH